MDPSRQVHFQVQLLNVVEEAVIATDLDGVVTYGTVAPSDSGYAWRPGRGHGVQVRAVV